MRNIGPEGEPRSSWRIRRKVIFLTLAFCAFCTAYIMFQGNDTRINETIILGCFGLAGSVIGFYVGGATWEDVNMEKLKSDNVRSGISTTQSTQTITTVQPVIPVEKTTTTVENISSVVPSTDES